MNNKVMDSIKIIEKKDKILKIMIKGEDYTLGNILQPFLLRDNRLMGAGYYISHPLSKELVITLYFKRKTDIERAKKILLENIDKAMKYLTSVKGTFLKRMEEM